MIETIFKHRIIILCFIACTVKDSNIHGIFQVFQGANSLSIKRDDVTGSTLLGSKVKEDITHMNKKHSVNFMLKLNR